MKLCLTSSTTLKKFLKALPFMTLKEKQQQVEMWISQFEESYWKPHEMYTAMVEEVGEVGREINHRFGPKKKKPEELEGDLAGELADVIFATICIANQQGIDLDAAWEKMMIKFQTRDGGRYKRK